MALLFIFLHHPPDLRSLTRYRPLSQASTLNFLNKIFDLSLLNWYFDLDLELRLRPLIPGIMYYPYFTCFSSNTC